MVFALVIGLGVWFVTESAPATAGAAIGGAIFGFFVTAVWSFVIGTGQSQAYQDGFVDPEAADAIIVALHVDDTELVENGSPSRGPRGTGPLVRNRRTRTADYLSSDPLGYPTRRSWPSQYGSRRSFFRILPLGLRGSMSAQSTLVGHL